jgi:hypothetical protein
MASIAELEADPISGRTKAALAAAKARGVKLGNPNGARALRGKQTGNSDAAAAIKLKAQEHASNMGPILEDIRAQGITSVRKTTEELNRRGILAPRGGEWRPTTVVRLLAPRRIELTTQLTKPDHTTGLSAVLQPGSAIWERRNANSV